MKLTEEQVEILEAKTRYLEDERLCSPDQTELYEEGFKDGVSCSDFCWREYPKEKPKPDRPCIVEDKHGSFAIDSWSEDLGQWYCYFDSVRFCEIKRS